MFKKQKERMARAEIQLLEAQKRAIEVEPVIKHSKKVARKVALRREENHFSELIRNAMINTR